MGDGSLALGWSVHTGWAVCVAVGGSLRFPRIVAREEVELLADPERFVFHRAAAVERARAADLVEQATTSLMARARAEVAGVLGRVKDTGAGEVVACAVVARPGARLESLHRILSAHPRIHTAEGCLYRDAIAGAARAAGLNPVLVAPDIVARQAARAAGVEESDVARLTAAAGKRAGGPWAKDHKAAALAGLGVPQGRDWDRAARPSGRAARAARRGAPGGRKRRMGAT